MTIKFKVLEAESDSSFDDVFIHELADVEDGAMIGPGTKIWRYAHVRAGARIGSNSMIGNCGYVDTGAVVGNLVRIQNGVLVYNGVTIEDEVFVGPSVTFTNDLYPRANGEQWRIVPTRICHGASLGANSTIVCGITVGAYAMVAAGSVVTKDVPPYTLVRGNPARVAGTLCVCGHKLSERCPVVGERYCCGECGREVCIG